MTIRPVLLALALLVAAGCSPRRIPGTEIEATRDTEAIYEVVRAYQQAMEKRDADAVLALVAPTYFDGAGTPDPGDDLDRGRLETTVREDLARAEGIRMEFTVRKIEVKGDEAFAEVFYDSYYRVQTPAGAIPRRDSDVHRLQLRRLQGAWKIASGL
jgi:ketosteroid isomerase-like protein